MQATTPSLEALRSLTQGREAILRGQSSEAIPYFKRAIELDPNFAIAYSSLGIAYENVGEIDRGIENVKKAFELRERTSERERLIDTSCSRSPADTSTLIPGRPMDAHSQRQ